MLYTTYDLLFRCPYMKMLNLLVSHDFMDMYLIHLPPEMNVQMSNCHRDGMNANTWQFSAGISDLLGSKTISPSSPSSVADASAASNRNEQFCSCPGTFFP